MQLVKVHVTNFRSVEDSEPFSIDQVTCLVGKNEAGKSAILLALAALNPHPATPAVLDKERDYPRRHLNDYSLRHPGEAPIAVSTEWKLSPAEIAKVEEELGKGAIGDRVTVYRRYFGEKPEWKVNLDLKRAIRNALETTPFSETQRATLEKSANTKELVAAFTSLETPTAEQQQLAQRITAYGTFTAKAIEILSPSLPRFMYFSNYDRMAGAIQIEQIQQQTQSGELLHADNAGKRLFVEFLVFAGVPIDDILSVKTYETFNARIQAASNSITDQILEYWTQNPDLRVMVAVSAGKSGDLAPLNTGTVVRARIYNDLHRVDTPFSERSAGFVWFFSFLVKFAQVKSDATPVVLLLDEPGLSLHGKAQGDLLRYFDEKLSPHHQVIYTTHSPFMVSPDKLTQARIVEDQITMSGVRRIPIGTKVREDILTVDQDTLFPLQGALGYEITQTLFIGKDTLLVEGVSDILYLQALSHALTSRRRVGLDRRWTVCPSGGIGNVRAFVSLFGGQRLNITVVADQTKGDRKIIEELRRNTILKSGRVFTVAEFTGKTESDIEDLFETVLFVSILNKCYELPAERRLTARSLVEADKNTERLVKKAEAAFNVIPEPVPTFDHFAPAAWLVRHLSELEKDTPPITETLERAERLFVAVNATLDG